MVQESGLKPKILIIAGPTASGKSDMALRAAQEFNGEVVSCDSMQIYRGMDIGTGKLRPEERQGIPHYMLDVVSVDTPFSVSDFKDRAEACIRDICARGKLPVLAGGTGLYINAILNGFDFAAAPRSDEVRERLKEEARTYGNERLYARLCQVDPISAAAISPNDSKRVIRALEIFLTTGQPKSARSMRVECPYDYLLIVLNPERERLYQKINTRVDEMLRMGLLDEVKDLCPYRDTQALQAIGYKEIVRYLETEGADFDATVEEIKRNTRRYAKRQVTFFKGMSAEKIFAEPDYGTISALIKEFMAKR